MPKKEWIRIELGLQEHALFMTLLKQHSMQLLLLAKVLIRLAI